MNPTVHTLLARAAAALTSSTMLSSAQAEPPKIPSSGSIEPDSAGLQQRSTELAKLVFGRPMSGHKFLARHGSHSSHASHASHSSHASHYSGTSSRSTVAPATTSTAAAPAAAPVARPLVKVAPVRSISAAVRTKLLGVGSRWPKQVKLVTRAYFHLDRDGTPAVVVKLEHERLDLVRLESAHAIVRVDGAEATLPLEQCDLVEQMGGEAAVLNLLDDAVVEQERAALGKLVKTRSRWPKTVRSRTPCELAVFREGRHQGTRTEPAGASFEIVAIDASGVTLRSQNEIAVLRVGQTDLLDQFGGLPALLALADDTAPENQAPK